MPYRPFSPEDISTRLGGNTQSSYDPRKTLFENAGLHDTFGNDDLDTYGRDFAATSDAKDVAGGNCPNGSVVMRMNVTAYTSGPESTGKRPGDPAYGITKNGATAGPGTIAAPIAYMDRRMYVPDMAGVQCRI